MRPLRLQIDNFTSFRGKQPALDLEAFDLLAIAGPTGSGKSSLLDAMIFALYGKVPRMGKGVGEMISLGRDRMSVVLEFRSGSRVYRVSRVARRGRSGEAQLEELTGGDERPLADGVKRVDEEIQGLLGLGYEAFTQAVILPQGEFAKFLKSQAAERQKILRDLLRLQVFDHMRKRAAEEVGRLKARMEEKDAILGKEYAAATPEAIAEGETQRGMRSAANAELRRQLEDHDRLAIGLRVRHAKTRELREKRSRLAELVAEEAAQVRLTVELESARRAAAVLPRVEAAEAAETAQAAATARFRLAKQEQQKASEAEARARAVLTQADSAAAEIPALTDRLRALDEVSGLIKPRDDARRRFELAQAERDQREAELVRARAEQSVSIAKAKAVETSLQGSMAALVAIGYDAQRHHRLEALRELGAGLGVRRAEWARLVPTLSEAEALLAKAAAEEASARSEQQAAEARWQGAERQLGQAEEALAHARDEHAAAHLRAALRKGEPCPVCDRRVDKLPGAATVPMLDEMVARRDAALAEERRARETATNARETTVRAEQAAAHAREGAERLCREQAVVRRAVEAGDASLAAVAGDLEGTEGSAPEQRLKVALTRCGEQREAHQQAAGERDRLEGERELWRQRTEHGEQASQALGEAVRAIRGRVVEAETEWRGLADRIASVAGTDQPAAERDRLASRRTSLEQARVEAEKAEREAALVLQSAQAELAEAQRALEAASDALSAARGALSAALREAGFETAQAARSAARPPAEQERLAALVEQHRRDRHAVELRLAELAAELAGAEVGDGELAAAERGLLELRQRLDEGLRQETSLDHELAELRRRAERAAALTRELGEIRGRHAVYRQLADDLGSDRFQAYLLEEAFAELVRGASERLLALSGRYTLEFSNNAFQVLDHENARERRSAETLSGGETFLASLALALELSQQVQRAAGAVHLDSLFIDEGFGTLDPDTMDTVADAIFSLPVGGRLVGIITHIPELTDRIPARLRVEKRPDGSEVRVELG